MLTVATALLVVTSFLVVYGLGALAGDGGPRLARTEKKRRVSIRFFINLGRWVQRAVGVDLRIKRKSVDTKLHQAGVAGRVSVRDLVALKIGSAVSVLCAAFLFASVAPGRLAYLVIFL